MGVVAELPLRCVVDASAGKDVRRDDPGQHQRPVPTLAHQLPFQKGFAMNLLSFGAVVAAQTAFVVFSVASLFTLE